VVSEGTPTKLIAEHTPGYVGIFNSTDREVLGRIVGQSADVHLHEDTSGLYVRTQHLKQLTSFHSEHGLTPQQIRPANLEDVFLKMTGQELTLDA
jgi:lipooligosaccharide transport system ATP-binding protein